MSSRRASRPIMHARPMKKRKAADSPQHAASRRPAEPSRQRKGASGSMGCTSRPSSFQGLQHSHSLASSCEAI